MICHYFHSTDNMTTISCTKRPYDVDDYHDTSVFCIHFHRFVEVFTSIFQNIVLRIERYHSVAFLGFAPCYFTPLELMSFFLLLARRGPRSETIRTSPTMFVLDTPGIRATTTRYPTNRVVAILMASAGPVSLLLSSVQSFFRARCWELFAKNEKATANHMLYTCIFGH